MSEAISCVRKMVNACADQVAYFDAALREFDEITLRARGFRARGRRRTETAAAERSAERRHTTTGKGVNASRELYVDYVK